MTAWHHGWSSVLWLRGGTCRRYALSRDETVSLQISRGVDGRGTQPASYFGCQRCGVCGVGVCVCLKVPELFSELVVHIWAVGPI